MTLKPLAAGSSANAPRNASLSRGQILWMIAWTFIVAIAGGFACGWLLKAASAPGSVGFLILGIVAGIAGRQITERPVRGFGVALVGAMLIAFYVAQCYWLLRVNFMDIDGLAVWAVATRGFFLIPSLMPEHFLTGLACLAMGIFSAYWRAATRGKPLFVKEEG